MDFYGVASPTVLVIADAATVASLSLGAAGLLRSQNNPVAEQSASRLLRLGVLVAAASALLWTGLLWRCASPTCRSICRRPLLLSQMGRTHSHVAVGFFVSLLSQAVREALGPQSAADARSAQAGACLDCDLLFTEAVLLTDRREMSSFVVATRYASQVWLPAAPLYAAVCFYVNTQMAAVAREVKALRQAKYEFKKV